MNVSSAISMLTSGMVCLVNFDYCNVDGLLTHFFIFIPLMISGIEKCLIYSFSIVMYFTKYIFKLLAYSFNYVVCLILIDFYNPWTQGMFFESCIWFDNISSHFWKVFFFFIFLIVLFAVHRFLVLMNSNFPYLFH